MVSTEMLLSLYSVILTIVLWHCNEKGNKQEVDDEMKHYVLRKKKEAGRELKE
jgi:hypothetical protein